MLIVKTLFDSSVDYEAVIYAISVGSLLVAMVIMLIRFVWFCLSMAFETVCNWSNRKLQTPNTKPSSTNVRKQYPNRKARVNDARDAIRRNADAYANRHKQ